MEMYILKSALCLAIFFVFYKALLENTSLHSFKRFYFVVEFEIIFQLNKINIGIKKRSCCIILRL